MDEVEAVGPRRGSILRSQESTAFTSRYTSDGLPISADRSPTAVFRQQFYRIGYFCATHPFVIFFVTFIAWTLCSLPLLLFGLGDLQPRLIAWSATSAPTGMEAQLPSRPEVTLLSMRLDVPRDATPDVNACRHIILTTMDTLKRIEGFHTEIGSRNVSFTDFCYQPDDQEQLCVLAAPGHFWKDDRAALMADPDPLETMTRSSAIYREAIVGGATHAWGSNQVIGFSSLSTTFAFETSDERAGDRSLFLQRLTGWLQSENSTVNANISWHFSDMQTTHLYFEVPQIELSSDVIFLVCTYVLVILYIYFSVETKFHMVKSKVGLGLTSVVMLLISLSMSVGICQMFGFVPTLVVVEVIPFLIIAVGVENIFFITHAVVATPLDNSVHHRVAEGLSNTGNKVVVYLLAELMLTIVGSLSSIDALREFSIFTFFSLLVDFYLQIIFFPAVLSIDIRRMELSDIQMHLKHCQTVHQPRRRRSRFLTRRPGKLISALAMVLLLVAAFILSESEGANISLPPYNTNKLLNEYNGILLDKRYVAYVPPMNGALRDIAGPNGSRIDLTTIHVSTEASIVNVALTVFDTLVKTMTEIAKEVTSHMWLNMVLIVVLFLVIMAWVWRMTSGLHDRLPDTSDMVEKWKDGDIETDQFGLESDQHSAEISQLVYSEQVLISSCTDSIVKVWHIDTGQCLRTYSFLQPDIVPPDEEDETVWSIAIAAKGLVAIGLGSGALLVDRLNLRSSSRERPGQSSYLDSPDQGIRGSAKAGSGGEQLRTRASSCSTLTRLNSACTSGVSCIATGSYYIISGDADGCVRAWSATAGLESESSSFLSLPSLASTSSDSDADMTSMGRTVPLSNITDLNTMRNFLSVVCHTAAVTVLEMSGQLCVSGSTDASVCILSLSQGAILHKLDGHHHAISSLSLWNWARGGLRVASGDENGTVCLWDAHLGKKSRALSGLTSAVLTTCVDNRPTFSHTSASRTLIMGCDFEQLIVWDARSGRACCNLPVPDQGLVQPAHLKNGLVAIGAMDSIGLYDAISGTCVRVIDLPKLQVTVDRREARRRRVRQQHNQDNDQQNSTGNTPNGASNHNAQYAGEDDERPRIVSQQDMSQHVDTTILPSIPVSVRFCGEIVVCSRGNSLFRLSRRRSEDKDNKAE
ncbi:hypothetical protein SARC_00207 [Sphaeroforma arctica JP610]|uniref:Sterol regulatory element-binding protein cleavage-activating protein n=1 Tax=Sphaeroforma arctica JP610 TaxID=667725 RepID=A0A0L0GFT6_9EUKA|nr:hypothetical protein SARC_00207 [Sphaeroforma arctica JP610]KNC87701.1 hypothetical protein SARC_00207 [Sphaeroforma arctica JP610]|eukprot:XP_014161603.1 hypothetical protein SARC_00207 [Sphaeroforma arctica JP610]